MNATLARRFWAKVEQADGCWLWRGYRDPLGRGRIASGGSKTVPLLAHRVSYELTTGDSECPVVMHACDNPACVNPAHLSCGTKAANSADMVRKGRSRIGENNPLAKLTEAAVQDIRSRYRGGSVTQAALAAEYGVCRELIRDVVRRKTWRHVYAKEGS